MIVFRIDNSRREFWVPIIQKLVLSLSDQQLLTGLAVLIAALSTHYSTSRYYIALMNDLAWFSAIVHLTTLTVLQDHLLEKPVLRNWRVGLMTIMALLLVASTVIEGQKVWYYSWPYDAQCVFDDLNGIRWRAVLDGCKPLSNIHELPNEHHPAVRTAYKICRAMVCGQANDGEGPSY